MRKYAIVALAFSIAVGASVYFLELIVWAYILAATPWIMLGLCSIYELPLLPRKKSSVAQFKKYFGDNPSLTTLINTALQCEKIRKAYGPISKTSIHECWLFQEMAICWNEHRGENWSINFEEFLDQIKADSVAKQLIPNPNPYDNDNWPPPHPPRNPSAKKFAA